MSNAWPAELCCLACGTFWRSRNLGAQWAGRGPTTKILQREDCWVTCVGKEGRRWLCWAPQPPLLTFTPLPHPDPAHEEGWIYQLRWYHIFISSLLEKIVLVWLVQQAHSTPKKQGLQTWLWTIFIFLLPWSWYCASWVPDVNYTNLQTTANGSLKLFLTRGCWSIMESWPHIIFIARRPVLTPKKGGTELLHVSTLRKDFLGLRASPWGWIYILEVFTVSPVQRQEAPMLRNVRATILSTAFH